MCFRQTAVVCRVDGRRQVFWAESREKSRTGARKGWGYSARAEMVGKAETNWKAEPVRLGSRDMCR